MRTVFAGLPFYDSVDKIDKNRVHSRLPFHCPRHQLPPFLINAQTDTPGAVTRVDLMDCQDNLTEITSYFVAVPALFTTTANDYFQYKGTVLKQALPRGQYIVKITTANGFVYYSENIVISDIYPNLITGWVNDAYETFTTSGTAITSAIETGVSGIATAIPSFAIRKGESITVAFALTLNSGQLPFVSIFNNTGTTISAQIFATAGANTITLTATQSTSIAFVVIRSTAASNFSTSAVFVMRSFSSRFIKLDFFNSKDLGDILYQDGWKQSLWLETRLNYPSSETVEIGEEKDGIFLPEKLITKYIYRISTYISRAMHAVLCRLPQHTSITITDEVGNTYTPAVGNLQITSMDWSHFETGHIVISFNDGDNSAFEWTYDMANLT